MTRRRRRQPTPKRRPRWVAWSFAAVVAALIATPLAIGQWPRNPRQARAPAEPWHGLSPRMAYEAGLERIKRDENLASLPYLRYALEQTRGQLWEVPYAMFAALRNESFATHERSVGRVRVARSSVDRVELVKGALYWLTQAEQAASRPRDIAQIRSDRADLLLAWGFPWEAFANYRDAQWADSTLARSALKADTLQSMLLQSGGRTQ